MVRMFIHRMFGPVAVSVHPDSAMGQDIDDHFWVTNEEDNLRGYGMQTWPCEPDVHTSEYLFQGEATGPDGIPPPPTLMVRITDMNDRHLQQTHRLIREKNPWNPVLKYIEDRMRRPRPSLIGGEAVIIDPLQLRPHSFNSCVGAAAGLLQTLPTLPMGQQVELLRMLADVVEPFAGAVADELRFPDLRVFPHEEEKWSKR